MSRNSITGLHDRFAFSFLRILHPDICSDSCNPIKSIWGFPFPHIPPSICCWLCLSLTLLLRWDKNLKVILICVFLISRDKEHVLRFFSHFFLVFANSTQVPGPLIDWVICGYESSFLKILYILDNKFFIHITGKCSLPFCDLPFNQGHHSFDVQELFDFMKFHLAIIGLNCLANEILKEARRKWTLTCRIVSSLMWVWEPKPVFSTAEQSLKMQMYFYIYYFDLVYWKIALGSFPLRGVNYFVLKRHCKRKLLMLLETPT